MNESSNKEGYDEKIMSLKEELRLEQETSKENLHRLKYLQADFENYKKRIEKEVQDTIQRSNQNLVSYFIDIIDDFESAISTGEKTENKNALLEGIKMVHKNICKLLKKEGLEKIECVGQPFDPNLHEVQAQLPTNDHKSGTVLEEARKGFMFKGKVLRPSVVNIACQASESEKK